MQDEIEFRGKILAMCIEVEDALTKIIYNYFLPNKYDKFTRPLFLKEIVLPLTFSKKKDIFKRIAKSDYYKNKLSNYLLEKKLINPENHKAYKSYDSYLNALMNLLKEISEVRNIAAHGKNMSSAFVSLEENEIILGNKLNFYKYDSEFLEEYKSKTLQAFMMLTMIKIKN